MRHVQIYALGSVYPYPVPALPSLFTPALPVYPCLFATEDTYLTSAGSWRSTSLQVLLKARRMHYCSSEHVLTQVHLRPRIIRHVRQWRHRRGDAQVTSHEERAPGPNGQCCYLEQCSAVQV